MTTRSLGVFSYTYACGHEHSTIATSHEEVKKTRAKAAAEPCLQCQEDASVPAALREVAYALRQLGNAGAATPMGAIEAFGLVVKDGLEGIASAISDHADAVRDLAQALKERKP